MARVLRGNVEIFAAYPEAFADRDTPTSTELNDTDFVKIISCAVEDSYTMNPTDSDTDNSMSVCDVAQVDNPTFANYEVSLDLFRDEDLDATGMYNLARDLFKNSGIPFIVGKRIGKAQGTQFAAGDRVSMYSVKTDNPVDIDSAGSPVQLGARFKPDGWHIQEYEVAS